jgi:hypothetical protein
LLSLWNEEAWMQRLAARWYGITEQENSTLIHYLFTKNYFNVSTATWQLLKHWLATILLLEPLCQLRKAHAWEASSGGGSLSLLVTTV